jgi:hypothetical protein
MNRTHVAAIAIAALIATPAAVALAGGRAKGHDHAQTLAVIGDVPYGDALIAELPADVAQINADPDVSRVIHLGDIKNGSSRCDDSYFQARLDDFQTFADPLVYTPGDNEWTDCHRANNGGYLPTERLAKIRELFFAHPGATLGAKAEVRPQSRGYPENVTWRSDGAQFGVAHVVGSNDDQFPWYADRRDGTGALVPQTPAEAALQAREFLPREAAALEWIDRIFDEAAKHDAPAVVLGMQADMWDGPASDQTAFVPIKAVLADRAARGSRWAPSGAATKLVAAGRAAVPAGNDHVVLDGPRRARIDVRADATAALAVEQRDVGHAQGKRRGRSQRR